MTTPRGKLRAITFAELCRLLLDLGFTEVVVPKSHVGFFHADSETEIFLPIHRPNQGVAPRHLAVVRTMLDAKGLQDGEEFDRLVADVATRQETIRARIDPIAQSRLQKRGKP
jgi:predicted RNA binding protein YcfA (HicA-like mRNA interferase family)